MVINLVLNIMAFYAMLVILVLNVTKSTILPFTESLSIYQTNILLISITQAFTAQKSVKYRYFEALIILKKEIYLYYNVC